MGSVLDSWCGRGRARASVMPGTGEVAQYSNEPLIASGGSSSGPPNPCQTQLPAVATLFNDDVNYSLETDTALFKDAPNSNFSSVAQLQSRGDPNGSSIERVSLLRWELPSNVVPSAATICSATIQLYVTDPAAGSYYVFQMLRPWVFNQASWNNATATDSWQVPGAQGPADRGGPIGAFSPGTANTMVSFSIPASVVQSWVNNPTQNYGVLIGNHANPDSVRVSSRNSTVANK